MADTADSRGRDGYAGRRLKGRRRLAWLPAPGSLVATVPRIPASIGGSLAREIEGGRGFYWLPVLFGLGVILYFAIPAEPSAPAAVMLACGLVAAAFVLRRNMVAPLAVALAVLATGFAVMKVRTDLLWAPSLRIADVLTVSGWVETRDPTGRTGARLVVRVAAMEGLDAAERPYRIRVTAQNGADWINVGDGVEILASLRPPQGAIIPGGHSFGQVDFYDRVGASGFSYGAPRPAEIGEPPLLLQFSRPAQTFRKAIGDRIVAALPGEPGQIARALITGERGGISDATNEALRDSGLAHVISISGLHMALVFGAVFFFVRALLALSPSLALRRPIKKWSVAAALLVVTAYFALSGASVPSQRAFVMIAVMSGAVLFDQRAFSIRNIVLAALIVLALTPEAILTASFQMSFAATLALIAGYEWVAEWRRSRPDLGERRSRSRVRAWIAGTILTSLIAGLATVPFAMYHFQRTAPLSLVANVLAAPAISVLVMPFAILTILLMPFGLEAAPLAVMGWGIEIMNGIAYRVAEWSNGGGAVRMAPSLALFLAAGGLLWLCLWRERWRFLGLLPLASAILVGFTADRPDILVNAAGTAVAVRGAGGDLHILGGRGASYEIETWLRSDADLRPANDPTLKSGVGCDALGCTAALADGTRVALSLDPRSLAEDCRLASIVITATTPTTSCGDAILIDGANLATGGAHAVFLDGDPGGVAPRIATSYPPIRRAFMPPLE
ncbi:MAG: ComEC/Rec2 family competence protein [Bauldia sp.]|nr:ComEC/Rec2 family competence protein [Bauldia sp.]